MPLEVLIIEDERPAQEHLKRLLSKVDNTITVVETLDTVEASVAWLGKHEVDLIFMDIQLVDGISFSIFEKIKIEKPVVFTTAYDEFAIKAFQVNSIDYLLKPIDIEDVKRSLEKYKRLQSSQEKTNIAALMQAFQVKTETYQERFLVYKGERLLSIDVDQIAYFEGEDRYVYLVKKDGARYIVNYRLSDLELILDSRIWFRLNRSFICQLGAITSMIQFSKSRIKVDLSPQAKREIIISAENCQAFKKWLGQ